MLKKDISINGHFSLCIYLGGYAKGRLGERRKDTLGERVGVDTKVNRKATSYQNGQDRLENRVGKLLFIHSYRKKGNGVRYW